MGRIVSVKELIAKLEALKQPAAEVVLFNEATGECDLPLARVHMTGAGIGLSPAS
jgi:hypothetical protein